MAHRANPAANFRFLRDAFQPFPVLATFLILLFATGGSSWAHEGQLIILRPTAIFVAAWGIARMQIEHWRDYRAVWTIFATATFITAAHLVPLPYSWWSSLGGREIIAEIDQVAGFGKIARPLSMQPEATMNALFSLAVPLAVLALGVQLDETAHRRIAGLMVALIAISAFVGLIQLSGGRIELYEAATEVHPSGLFNNRNHQAALLAMALPLAILTWRGGYKSGVPIKLERMTATALAIFVLPLALVTGSRSGLFLLSLAFLGALINVPSVAGWRRNRKLAMARIVAITGSLGLLAWLTIWVGRADAISRLLGTKEDLRVPVWSSIVEAIPTYMPWGTGVGTYADAYQILEPDALLRPTFSNHAHNEWLEIAFTAGVPGLLVLALAVVAFAFGAIKALRSRGDAGALPRAATVLILLLALASTTDYPVRTPIMSGILALAALWLSKDFHANRAGNKNP